MIHALGKYEVLRLLGKGTMGEVYLGRDPLLDRLVALKTIQSGSAFAGEEQARFEREARAMASLNHPGIVTIYDFGVSDGVYFLAMEYLEGEDLASLIQRGTLTKLELLEVVVQVCEGLGYTHAQGIVHRDVKPANILVALGGRAPVAKLLDFGVAAVDRSTLTAQGTWMGTASYMAPEYLDSGKASPSADLFAAGVIIYEILSGGRRPFPGETPAAVLGAILHKPPLELDPADTEGIPSAVLEVMERALAKDPALRHATGEELAEALRGALASPPGPGASRARQILVGRGGGASYLSLRVALRQAQDGDVIEVLPGLYRESLVLDKAVTLQGGGDGAECVVESPSGSCVAVEAASCALRGLTFRGRDAAPALDLLAGSLTLENCSVLNPAGPGLRLGAEHPLEATDCRFESQGAEAAILEPGSTSRFLRCTFGGGGAAGVLALEGAQATLEDCTLAGEGAAGLHALGGARIRLTECRLEQNQGLGLSLVDGARAELDGCRISGNGEPGLLLHRQGSASLTRCQVTDGRSFGIACHGGAVLALAHTEVRGNAQGGILLAEGVADPAFGDGNTLEDAVLR
jgi:hypothetical protein